MADLIILFGESGTGKTTSLRNMNPAETFVVSCAGKKFIGWKKYYNEDKAKTNIVLNIENPMKILDIMDFVDKKRKEIKYLIIDDFWYSISLEFLTRAKEKGWDKYTDFANYFTLPMLKVKNLRDDLTVVFILHTETETVESIRYRRIKTLGKLVNEKIGLEGLTNTVLESTVYKDNEGTLQYAFRVKNDGASITKTPFGMFEDNVEYIPNDLKAFFDIYNKFKEENM